MLIPNFPLVKVSILSQVLNGMLLPVVLVFMLKLINKHELMGKYTNSRWFNVVAWATAVIVIALSLVPDVESRFRRVSQLKQLSFGEVADQAQVGGQEVEARQLRQRGPAHIVEDAVLDVAGKLAHHEELKVDGAAVAVFVADLGDAAADDGGDAELFVEFARRASSAVSPGSILPPGNSHLGSWAGPACAGRSAPRFRSRRQVSRRISAATTSRNGLCGGASRHVLSACEWALSPACSLDADSRSGSPDSA